MSGTGTAIPGVPGWRHGGGWLRAIVTAGEDRSSSFEPANWASSNDTIKDQGTLWESYLVLVDLYKFYVDIIWKVSVWYYGVAGALLAYFFGHLHEGNPFLPWTLLPLAIGSAVISLLHMRGIPQLLEMRDWLEYIAETLRLPGRPHVEVVATFMFFNGVLLGIGGIALITIMVAPLT